MSQKNEQLFIELVGMQGSGFIKDGTAGTAHQEELKAPTVCFVPSTGYRKGKGPDGKIINIPIRYIKNCPYIDVSDQEKNGWKPNRYEDIIQIDKGYATITKDDGDPALVEFLEKVYYNESNPDRSSGATAIYRVVKVDEKSEKFVENEIAWLEAGAYLAQLHQKKGGEHVFQTEKVDSIIALLGLPVGSERASAKFEAVMRAAKSNPIEFMKRVTKLEESSITDVTHALELNVISFKGNVLQYTEKDEVIHNFGIGNYKQDKKIEMASIYFSHPDNAEKLKIFKAALAYAKQKQLENV